MRDATPDDARRADANAMAGSVTIRVRGESLELRADRSLFWPRQRWLIVADLHLGKAESLRRDGVALPDRVMDEDLARLGQAMRETGAERLLVLGDLVHDARGMTSALLTRVAAWRTTIAAPVSLIPGNHDRRVRQLPPAWQIEQLPAALPAAPFVFTHDPSTLPSDAHEPQGMERTAEGTFTWHGHVHPVVSVRGLGDRLRLPCFAVGETSGVLPAFSTLTGGSTQWRGAGVRCWATVEGRVIEVPCG